MEKQKVALVLSGGGARGLAHIGVIEELEQQGYEISSVAGTSMGALVGGTYASGHMEDYKLWMNSLDKRKVLNLVDFTLSRHGIMKGDKVFKYMKDFVPENRIENLRIPFAAVAADLVQQEEIVFKEGSLYEAIRASVSIPTVLTPVKSGDRLLVDGGVLNNIPIDHVERNEGDVLVVVHVNANVPLIKPPSTPAEDEKKERIYQKRLKEFYDYLPKRHKKEKDKDKDELEHFGYFDLLNKTTAMMGSRIAESIIEKHKPDILINVSRDSCGTFDFYRSEEVVENGRWAARAELGSFGASEPRSRGAGSRGAGEWRVEGGEWRAGEKGSGG